MDLTPLLAAIPPQYFVYISALWAIAKIINATFPQPASDSPWYLPRTIIRVLVCNVGHAADVVPSSPSSLPKGQ